MSVRIVSFAPVLGLRPRVLILGSMPGVRSLAQHQYYAHPQNLFWPLMGALCDAGPELPYTTRIARLKGCGIALWDVLGECERSGSLDTAIVRASEQPNDIAGLLARRRSLHTIACNGARAWQAFRRHVLPHIAASRQASLELMVLPSTSPANASVPCAVKRERWLALRERLAE